MNLQNSYGDRLRGLYANYFGGLRQLFGMPSAPAQTPAEQREQRWEGEGGRTADAPNERSVAGPSDGSR